MLNALSLQFVTRSHRWDKLTEYFREIYNILSFDPFYHQWIESTNTKLLQNKESVFPFVKRNANFKLY